MPEPDLIELFAQPLNQAGVRYLVSGIRAMLAVSGELLDHPALEDWIVRLGLEADWKRVTG